jgi:hypothetical protein
MRSIQCQYEMSRDDYKAAMLYFLHSMGQSINNNDLKHVLPT